MVSFWKASNNKSEELPAEKRISTAAGQRLSVIVDNGNKDTAQKRASVRQSAAALGLPPRESSEESSQKSNGYTYSVWSEAQSAERLGGVTENKKPATINRNSWRKLALIVTAVLLVLIAIIVGTVVGLKKKHSSNSAASSGASPTSTATAKVSVPDGFPAGSYSIITFLDTVQTDCTANASTWTCYPYTIYNDDQTKSRTTFNWNITGSSGSYKISSTDNPFGVTFQNKALNILDEGKDTERYRFQFSIEKDVVPSTALTSDGSSTLCKYSATTFQAYLYTKQVKSFPASDDASNAWPFRVRVEQVMAGGQDVPTCYNTNNGVTGDRITDGLTAQDGGALCSCLYKNWRTP